MLESVRSSLAVCFRPDHLARTLTITLLVGTWLTLFNHGGVMLSSGGGTDLWLKVFLNYLTPFVVSNWGLLSRKTDSE